MTDKEKAKAYDEVLEQAAKELNTCGSLDCDAARQIFRFFPQLRESEDEKIRKALIDALKVSETIGELMFRLPYPTREECIAYLEKQKEQSITANDLDEEIHRFFDECIEVHDAKIYGVDERVITVDCYEITARHFAKWGEKQKEQKPKQVPKWLYRLEFKDNSCGLWYNGQGEWCFENGIGSLDDSCKTKNLPMDYDERYKQDGRNWFSSCSKKEDLLHWYSKEDAKTLLNKGFVFTRYLATEYHEYDQQTVFIKETALYREEINFLELMKEQKPVDFPTTDEEVNKFLETHPKVEVPEKYKTPDFVFKKKEYEYHPIISKDTTSVKSAEWSDEDKAMIKSILFVLESYVSQSESASSPSLITTYPTYYKEIDWLKSLRPVSKESLQPHWKPSEEQINALYDILHPVDNVNRTALEELYEQLKKLM